jgi:hypothetical protein
LLVLLSPQVRVGSGSAPLSQRARDVWLEALVNQYLSAQSIHDVQAKLQEFRRCASLPAHIFSEFSSTVLIICQYEALRHPMHFI